MIIKTRNVFTWAFVTICRTVVHVAVEYVGVFGKKIKVGLF